MIDEEKTTQLLEDRDQLSSLPALTYPFTTLSAELANLTRYTRKNPSGREIEDALDVTYWDLDGNVITENRKYKREPRLSEFEQTERIEILRTAYLHNRGMMLRTIRRIIRLYTHPDKNDIQLFVQDEMVSCSKFFDRLEEIAKLLFKEIENSIAIDIYDEFTEFNFEKAFEIEAAKEIAQNPITNADILKECEKSKTEIINMMKTFVERQEKIRLPPDIIKQLIDTGQLKQEPDTKTGKYIAFKTPFDFLCWCYENDYEDEINAAFVAEYIKTECSLETLKKYEREARDIADKKRKPRKIR